ncbi:MAG: adenylate/guanylate cyclase domain-containing protein, partial [Betaproteobacteria bacterium]|nr:adenylate/guanylate cyclase domain-containing protein [Betaproteobacteria bacterium]
TVYEPLGDVAEPAARAGVAEPADELSAWHDALAAYRAQRWGEAEAALARLLQQHSGHTLYTLYAQRVREFQQQPPGADWDGSTRFDHK